MILQKYQEVRKLYGDPYIKNRKGIFEYILGGATDTKLLEVRVFDEATKKTVYEAQTAKAKRKKVNQIARTVRLDTMQTKKRFGILRIWMPTMYRLGAKVAQLQ